MSMSESTMKVMYGLTINEMIEERKQFGVGMSSKNWAICILSDAQELIYRDDSERWISQLINKAKFWILNGEDYDHSGIFEGVE